MSEFSRPVRVDTIGSEPRDVSIGANEAERTGLAKRFDIERLESLSATASVVRRGGDIHAAGSLSAKLVQLCAGTGVELPAAFDVPFSITFRSELPSDVPDAGIELSAEELDVVFYDGSAIDLGEAVAETLALSIDPYARAENADAVLRAAGVKSEDEARDETGPFAALAGLNQTKV